MGSGKSYGKRVEVIADLWKGFGRVFRQQHMVVLIRETNYHSGNGISVSRSIQYG